MTNIIDLNTIKSLLNGKEIDIIDAVEVGFVKYSNNECIIPPVGEMKFNDPPGDVHIKYGFIDKNNFFIIKIASIFYKNKKLKKIPNNGMMLLFDQKTGEPLSILLDNGYLTQARTAAAGAVVAKYLAPRNISKIGIFGAGIQGLMQLQYLYHVISCQDVVVWGLNNNELDNFKKNMINFDFNITTTMDIVDIIDNCNLIVTATPTKNPYFKKDYLNKGVHITAVGSDTMEKQELNSNIFEICDIVAADSRSQCLTRGEIHHALDDNFLSKNRIIEIGELICDQNLQRLNDDQTSIADLTGVAIQDLQISKIVYKYL